MRSRWRKLLAGLIVGVIGFLAVVEVLAWLNVRAQREKRAYLGDRLYAEIRGQGPPVVFIAGLQGSIRYWGRSFDSLQSDHRLIFVDLLGFGRSQWPLHEPTLDEHLAWLRRTLVALGATRNVTIVAHSFGTIIAAHYSARHSTEIDRVVLLGTPVFTSVDDASRRIREMSSVAALFALNPIIARESCLIMGAFRPFFRRLAPLLGRRISDEAAADALLHDWPSINGAIQNILLRIPTAPAILKLAPKVVFVHGIRDSVTPVERIQALARRAKAKIILVDGDHQDYVIRYSALITRLVKEDEASPISPGSTSPSTAASARSLSAASR